MWAGLAVVVLAVIGVVAMYLVGSAIEVGADKAAAEADETAEEDSLAAVSDLPPSFDQLKAPLDVDSLPAKLARRISLGAEAAKEAIVSGVAALATGPHSPTSGSPDGWPLMHPLPCGVACLLCTSTLLCLPVCLNMPSQTAPQTGPVCVNRTLWPFLTHHACPLPAADSRS